MKDLVFKTLIISTLLFTASNAFSNTSSGGSTFALREEIKFIAPELRLDQNLLNLSNTSSGGETFKIHQAALDVSEGETFKIHQAALDVSEGETFKIHQAALDVSKGRQLIVEQILKNYRPELTTYFSEIRALVEDSTPNKMKSPIHESLTVTMLKIYGDYEEEEAIEAVIESPSESSDELRQIIYSL